MDPSYNWKYIVDLSEEELVALGFLGDGVSLGIQSFVQQIRGDPKHLGTVTCFTIDLLKRTYTRPVRTEAANPLQDAAAGHAASATSPPTNTSAASTSTSTTSPAATTTHTSSESATSATPSPSES